MRLRRKGDAQKFLDGMERGVTTLLDMLAKQGLHQLTSGSNVGGSVGAVAGGTSGVAAAATAADMQEMEVVDGKEEEEEEEEEEDWDGDAAGEGEGEDEGEGETDEESDGEGGLRVAALLAQEEESNVWMTFNFT